MAARPLVSSVRGSVLNRVVPVRSSACSIRRRGHPNRPSGLHHPNREQRSGQTALDFRSRQRVNGTTLRGDDDNEDNADSLEPFGPMGVAGDIFVASRRRCEDIDFRLAPRSPRQDPSALLPIRVVRVTGAITGSVYSWLNTLLMPTEPIRLPAEINVPRASIVGRFSVDPHWPILGDRRG